MSRMSVVDEKLPDVLNTRSHDLTPVVAARDSWVTGQQTGRHCWGRSRGHRQDPRGENGSGRSLRLCSRRCRPKCTGRTSRGRRCLGKAPQGGQGAPCRLALGAGKVGTDLGPACTVRERRDRPRQCVVCWKGMRSSGEETEKVYWGWTS